MRGGVVLLTAVVAGSHALVGCGGVDESVMPSPDSAASTDRADAAGSPTAASAEDQSAVAVGWPDKGTCWAVPADAVADQDYWFDDSEPVACTEPHTTQTAYVFPLEEPTIAAAETMADACWNRVRLFLGINANHWVPWGWFMTLPSQDDIADGASWVRCDAVFPGTWDFETVRTVSGSAAGIAVDPPADYWACLDEDPEKPRQPFVPCDQPHRYEQTGTLAILTGLDGVTDYPSPAERDAAAQDQCIQAAEGEAGDIAATAVWDDKSVLEQITEIVGVCFIFNTNGDPLPPRS